jgi:hypothetical protein
MAEQARLDVVRPQRFVQQRIVEQIDLADGQINSGRSDRVRPHLPGFRAYLLFAC